MLGLDDVQDILSLQLLGIIPESKSVLSASNAGVPVILDEKSEAGQAYEDVVARYLGEDRPLRFIDDKRGFFRKLFGGRS
jgi:septum site-determining protein MinD